MSILLRAFVGAQLRQFLFGKYKYTEPWMVILIRFLQNGNSFGNNLTSNAHTDEKETTIYFG